MNAKRYLITYYTIAGIIIALFTAVMTYIIIDVPIGSKMIFKIFLTILATLPIIATLSYFIGSNLSRKLAAISQCLNKINEDKFLNDTHQESITDIATIHTSIHQLSNRLENSITTLKNSNTQLNHMIRSLSHDIKTPLTIIEGYLEEIEDGLITQEKQPSIITILKKETTYMNELSSSVIHYLQSLEHTIHSKSIALKVFLHDEVCPLIRVKDNVTLSCQIDKDFHLDFDHISLKSILVNLLHNASKHTHTGSITVRSLKTGISIEDTGIGIDPKDEKIIFEPFYCLDESKNREENGFGLGLSIAKNLANQNGYTLSLDPNYKNGSRFILERNKDLA